MSRSIAATRLSGTRRATGVVVATILAVCVLAGSASAATPAPGWGVMTHVYPTNLQPGQEGLVVVELFNTGAAPSQGIVTLTDTLPPGLTATGTGGVGSFGYVSNEGAEGEEGEEEREQKSGGDTSEPAGIWARAWSCSGTTV